MTIKTVVEFTQEEIENTIKILDFLSSILDSDNCPRDIHISADNAFGEIATILCLDSKGEKAFHAKGW